MAKRRLEGVRSRNGQKTGITLKTVTKRRGNGLRRIGTGKEDSIEEIIG